ncbi:MAG: hypothetical protein V3S01_00035 [Dehalococcoidia bacterium]
MRLAYIAGSIPRRGELAGGPIDAEWLLDASSTHTVSVFVDHEGEGTELLRLAGHDLNVSPKRDVPLPGEKDLTAQEAQARILLDQHLTEPFDAIIYDSSHTNDWAWHEPRLATIPRGVALGAGHIRDLRVITGAPAAFRRYGRRLWATSGFLASADFILSDSAPSSYGLNERQLPPRFSLTALPNRPPQQGPAAQVAIVAFSESPHGLSELLAKALDRIAADDTTQVAIISPDVVTGLETSRDFAKAGMIPGHASAVRFVEPSSDGVAEAILAQADVIVTARNSDLAVRGVADAAAKVGAVVLDPVPSTAPILDRTALAKVPAPQPILTPVDGTVGDLIPAIDELDPSGGAVILHTRPVTETAQRIAQLPGLSRADLGVVTETGRFLGEPDPAWPAFNILSVSMAAWPSVRRLADQARSLNELIVWCMNLSHFDKASLLTLPVNGVATEALPRYVPRLPVWLGPQGMYPAPNLAELGQKIDEAEDDESLPDDFEDDVPPPPPTVQEWAQSHGFRDRIRLALPWKWDLLPKAMRERW